MLRNDIPRKMYEYKGLYIYKYFAKTYILYDEQTQQTILITSTLKKMKEEIDAWQNAIARRS